MRQRSTVVRTGAKTLTLLSLCASLLAFAVRHQIENGQPAGDLIIPYRVVLKIIGFFAKDVGELAVVPAICLFGVGLIYLSFRLPKATKSLAHITINLISMAVAVVAAIALGWADKPGDVPFAVSWFLVCAPKKDSNDLLSDFEDQYPVWVKQYGPMRASWFCYGRLVSYYGHRLVTEIFERRRTTSR